MSFDDEYNKFFNQVEKCEADKHLWIKGECGICKLSEEDFQNAVGNMGSGGGEGPGGDLETIHDTGRADAETRCWLDLHSGGEMLPFTPDPNSPKPENPV